MLQQVRSDLDLKVFQPPLVVYGGRRLEVQEDNLAAVEEIGMPHQHWVSYRDQVNKLGLAGGNLKADRWIEFRVDRGSFLNGNSYKGYEYTECRPAHLRSSLDDYRVSESDRDQYGNWVAYKRLKGDWYLYLFVNR